MRFGTFADERRLTDAQIRTIAEWVPAGAPEGDASETPAPPDFKEGWQLGPPDLILEAQAAYTLPGPDVFWNFIIPAAVTTTRYIRAIEIRPGDKRLVHHANLYIDRARSTRRQEIAEGQGFPGMDVAVISFNVDDDPAVIVPYLAQNHYTFPILRANELVDAYLSVAFIPQTWFLDVNGKLGWIHEGYGGDAKWLETMTAKLAQVMQER